MYSMMTIANNSISHIWKLLGEYILKVLNTRQKKKCSVTIMVMDVNSKYTVIPVYPQGIGSRTPFTYQNPWMLKSLI